ncbi:MAG TPA: hypothetical protein VF767_01390 [Bryobacteraceae bacterium]
MRPKNIKQAATQFEALLMAQMLKDMRASSGSGWMGAGEEDQSSSCMLDLAEEHLSQTLASQGGLGLAKMMIAGVGKRTSSGTDAGASPAAPAVKPTP